MQRASMVRNPSKGAAAVEMALVLPILASLLFGIMEFALIGRDKLTLVQAARAGARAASLGKTISDIRWNVKSAAGDLPIADSQIQVTYDDGTGQFPYIATDDGYANTIPSGALAKVSVVNWPHQMATGSFFNWLPGVSGGNMLLSASMVMRRE